MTTKLTKQQKDQIKKQERKLRKTRQQAYNMTSLLIRFWPSLANIGVSSVICFLVIRLIPQIFKNWGASDPSQYTGMLITCYVTVVIIWLLFMGFSIHSICKEIKKSK